MCSNDKSYDCTHSLSCQFWFAQNWQNGLPSKHCCGIFSAISQTCSLRILVLHCWDLMVHIAVLQGAKCKTRAGIIDWSRDLWHGGNSSWDSGSTWWWWCWWYDPMLHLFMAISSHSLGCRRSESLPSMQPSLCLGLKCLLAPGQAKWKWNLPW